MNGDELENGGSRNRRDVEWEERRRIRRRNNGRNEGMMLDEERQNGKVVYGVGRERCWLRERNEMRKLNENFNGRDPRDDKVEESIRRIIRKINDLDKEYCRNKIDCDDYYLNFEYRFKLTSSCSSIFKETCNISKTKDYRYLNKFSYEHNPSIISDFRTIGKLSSRRTQY